MIPSSTFFADSIGFVITDFIALNTDDAVDLMLLKIDEILEYIFRKIEVAELRIPEKFPFKPDAIAFQIEVQNEAMLVHADLIAFKIPVQQALTILILA
ncbi:hypothetical protein CKQ69_31065 [Bacillus toyonensis]|nr:hypothetical protein CKQ69_31065 [Bacillus toyonensis]